MFVHNKIAVDFVSQAVEGLIGTQKMVMIRGVDCLAKAVEILPPLGFTPGDEADPMHWNVLMLHTSPTGRIQRGYLTLSDFYEKEVLESIFVLAGFLKVPDELNLYKPEFVDEVRYQKGLPATARLGMLPNGDASVYIDWGITQKPALTIYNIGFDINFMSPDFWIVSDIIQLLPASAFYSGGPDIVGPQGKDSVKWFTTLAPLTNKILAQDYKSLRIFGGSFNDGDQKIITHSDICFYQ